MNMTEAIELLNPETSWKEQAKIKFDGGTDKDVEKAVDEACLIACRCMEKQIPKKPNNKCIDDVGYLYYQVECGNCGRYTSSASEILYCPECGQRILWEAE